MNSPDHIGLICVGFSFLVIAGFLVWCAKWDKNEKRSLLQQMFDDLKGLK